MSIVAQSEQQQDEHNKLLKKIPLLIQQLRTKYEAERNEIAHEVQEHLQCMRMVQSEALDAQAILLSNLEDFTTRLDAMETASIEPQSELALLSQQMQSLNHSLRQCQEEQQLLKAAIYNDRLVHDEDYHKRRVLEEELYLRIRQAEESSELLRTHLHTWRTVNSAVMENGRVLMQFVDDNHVKHGQQNLLTLQQDVLKELGIVKQSHKDLMLKIQYVAAVVDRQDKERALERERDSQFMAQFHLQQQQKGRGGGGGSGGEGVGRGADRVGSVSAATTTTAVEELGTHQQQQQQLTGLTSTYASTAASPASRGSMPFPRPAATTHAFFGNVSRSGSVDLTAAALSKGQQQQQLNTSSVMNNDGGNGGQQPSYQQQQHSYAASSSTLAEQHYHVAPSSLSTNTTPRHGHGGGGGGGGMGGGGTLPANPLFPSASDVHSPATLAGLSRIFGGGAEATSSDAPNNTNNSHHRRPSTISSIVNHSTARGGVCTTTNGAKPNSTTNTTSNPLLRSRLELFYSQYNPSKLASINEIMEEYRGAEAELMAALEVHYGAVGYFSRS